MSENSLTIFSAIEFSEAQWGRLRAVCPGVRVVQVPTRDVKVVRSSVREADVAVVYHDQDFDPALAPRLKWVQTTSAGVEAFVGGKLWNSEVPIVNASGVAAAPIAEHAIAMVLALRHRLPYLWERQKEHAWAWRDPRARSMGELAGLTLGVIGYGSIGREVGRLGKAFGMRLIATTIDASARRDTGFSLAVGDPEGALPEVLGGPELQEDLLRQSDVVVVAVPSTPATRRLLGESAFGAMKPMAILVNVSRGSVVDEAALVRALREGRIGGAALDVFEKEPLPADSPLWELPNVLVSPHVAAESPGYWERLMSLLVENVRRTHAGEPLVNVVDKQLAF